MGESAGDLRYIENLQNLDVLNISHNNFSGSVPETSFFSKLPPSVLIGNPNLYFSNNKCPVANDKKTKGWIVVLSCIGCVILSALYIILGSLKRTRSHDDFGIDNDHDMRPPWEITLYRKLEISIEEVVISDNVI